jgi:hypothetical protein
VKPIIEKRKHNKDHIFVTEETISYGKVKLILKEKKSEKLYKMKNDIFPMVDLRLKSRIMAQCLKCSDRSQNDMELSIKLFLYQTSLRLMMRLLIYMPVL